MENLEGVELDECSKLGGKEGRVGQERVLESWKNDLSSVLLECLICSVSEVYG